MQNDTLSNRFGQSGSYFALSSSARLGPTARIGSSNTLPRESSRSRTQLTPTSACGAAGGGNVDGGGLDLDDDDDYLHTFTPAKKAI